MKQTPDSRIKLQKSSSQLGLKLPLNPVRITINKKGEVLVMKDKEEQGFGEEGMYYKYGGLYGERAVKEGTIDY